MVGEDETHAVHLRALVPQMVSLVNNDQVEFSADLFHTLSNGVVADDLHAHDSEEGAGILIFLILI